MANTAVNELDWLLDELVKRVAGVDRAVVLSADGLLIGRSSNLSAGDGEHHGACLALLADEQADVGMIAYEMNMMVKRVGAVLTAKPREFMERPVL